jgi:hypothetical protein
MIGGSNEKEEDTNICLNVCTCALLSLPGLNQACRDVLQSSDDFSYYRMFPRRNFLDQKKNINSLVFFKKNDLFLSLILREKKVLDIVPIIYMI